MPNPLAPFANRAAIIFGGSEGIGYGIAKALSAHVSRIGLVARSNASLEQAGQSLFLARRDLKLAIATADIRNTDAVQSATAQIISELGEIGIAVNSAGHALPGFFSNLSPDQFKDQFDVHVVGSVNAAKALIPHLTAQKQDTRLVFVASDAALQASFGWSAYCAAKFGQVGLAQALRSEYANTKLKISCLCPAAVDTPGYAKENLLKPESVRKFELGMGLYSADEVAAELVRKLPSAPLLMLPGRKVKLHNWLLRLAPALADRLGRMPKPD